MKEKIKKPKKTNKLHLLAGIFGLILTIGLLTTMIIDGSGEALLFLIIIIIFALYSLAHIFLKKKTRLAIGGILKILGLILLWTFIIYFIVIHVILATFLCFLSEIGIGGYSCSIPGR